MKAVYRLPQKHLKGPRCVQHASTIPECVLLLRLPCKELRIPRKVLSARSCIATYTTTTDKSLEKNRGATPVASVHWLQVKTQRGQVVYNNIAESKRSFAIPSALVWTPIEENDP